MTGSSEEGLMTQIGNPRHRGGAFEGVIVACLVSFGAIAVSQLIAAHDPIRIAIIFLGLAGGAGVGWIVTRAITDRRARRRAEFEAGVREIQEADNRRKMRAAIESGVIQ